MRNAGSDVRVFLWSGTASTLAWVAQISRGHQPAVRVDATCSKTCPDYGQVRADGINAFAHGHPRVEEAISDAAIFAPAQSIARVSATRSPVSGRARASSITGPRADLVDVPHWDRQPAVRSGPARLSGVTTWCLTCLYSRHPVVEHSSG
jgi:hypothetical protein